MLISLTEGRTVNLETFKLKSSVISIAQAVEFEARLSFFRSSRFVSLRGQISEVLE